jgi:hypothetical protein
VMHVCVGRQIMPMDANLLEQQPSGTAGTPHSFKVQ